jgi:nitrate ABC transporter ATP-binding subunit
MKRPLEITGLSKSFATPNGPYTAIEDINLTVAPGEFLCLLGHSGCGKSTLLSIIAGLDKATQGGYCIDGKEVDEPGPERAMVFQSPCLLPWMTAQENVLLALNQVSRARSRERRRLADHYLDLVGVREYARHRPAELSLGTQQRVALARALALQPRFLLLDEPFGMLDSLTRFELQDVLLRLWERERKTVIMVTHDIDEALYLSDRIVLMTDGPRATIGRVICSPFERPRERTALLRHPEYRRLRLQMTEFLEEHAQQLHARRLAS